MQAQKICSFNELKGGRRMKYKCALFVVNDIQRSRDFYENLLGQTVKYEPRVAPMRYQSLS